MRKILNKLEKNKIISILIFIVFLFWTRWFIGQENTIYYWGFSDYWRRYIEASNIFRQDGLIKILWSSFQSIRFDEYNSFSVLFLFMGWMLDLVSRWQYILLVSVIFVGGTWIAFYNLIKNFISKKKQGKVLVFSLIFLLIIPILWQPVLQGYLDVGGLVFIFIIWRNHLRKDFADLKISEILVRGLLLSLLVIFRRYFVYWVISYFLMSILEQVYEHRKAKEFFFKGFINIGLVGMTSFLIYFLMAYPLSYEMIMSNYSVAYSAYKESINFFVFLWKSFSQFGGLLILVIFWGVIKYLKGKERKLVLFSIGQTIFTLYLFFGVQDLGIQHYYLIIPMVLLTVFILFLNCKNKLYILILSVAWFLNFVVGFNILKVKTESLSPLLTQTRLIPLNRDDMPVFRDVFETLERIENEDEGKIYVLASSNVINKDILVGYCYLPNGNVYWDICDRILDPAEVDLRDGFPANLVQAKYILVTDPIQYHLKDENQKVVQIPAKMILENNGIGKLYYRLPYEFNLGPGREVKLMIYKANGQNRLDEMKNLSKIFMEKYSNNKEIFIFNGNNNE